MKNNKPLMLILGILLALALAAGLYFGVRAINKNNTAPTEPAATGETQPTGGETGETGETQEPLPETFTAVKAKDVYTEADLTGDDPRFDQVVATCGDETLTNRGAQIYYFMQYFGFMNQYGAYASYFGLDTTKPLSEQASMSEDLTWEQFFLASGMEQFQQYAAVAAKAKAEGHTLTDEEAESLKNALDGMADEGSQYGFDSADAYIQASFGPGVTLADYTEYLNTYFLAMSYENDMYSKITWTDEDLQAYYEAHPEEFEGIGTDSPNVNVRHILISFEDTDEDGETSDEEKAAAKAKAEEILAGYEGNPTEDNFAELANEHSTDPGSNTNGGLYEGVYPGQMVETFNDWCFDPARQTGDTGIVETTYGYHIMYFVGKTDTYYWKTLAEQNYPMTIMQASIDEIMNAAPLTVNYADVILSTLPEEPEENAPTAE